MGLVTRRAAAATAGPNVQDTEIDADDVTDAKLQVPSAVAVTVAPATKPVPARLKDVVAFAWAVPGATAVTVGAD